MINLMRKHQQTLMILITILVIIAFVWFYNGTRSVDKIGSDRVATMSGRNISKTDIDRESRRYQIALELGLIDIVRGLGTVDQNQPTDNFVFNVMVLRDEAQRLQVEPTDDEVRTAIQELPAFQTEGAFDAQKLTAFVANKLMPRGFTDTQIDDLLRDELRLKKVKSIVSATTIVTPAEFRAGYESERQKTEASVVRMKFSDFAANVKLSDDDVKKAYEQRKESLTSEEQRRIKFVTLALTDAEKELKGKQRIDSLQALANKANDFTQGMLERDAKFDAVASRFQLPVTEAGPFTQSKPDPKVSNLPAVSEAAFKLTLEDPNSDVVQTEDGFYILHLEQIIPSKPLTFEEAKPRLEAQLKLERAREQLTQKATETRNKIEAEMKAGKSFADAAQAAGQKAEKLPAFSLAELAKGEDMDQRQVMEKCFELNIGQVSEVVSTPDGAALICVEKRLPIDEAEYTKDLASLLPQYESAKHEIAFREWLRTRREAAKIRPARS